MAAFLDEDELESDSSEDLYVLLNIDRNASKEDIDSSYRKLTKIYHPDRHVDPKKKKDAELIFHKLNKAHQILTDPIKRATYNRFGMKGLEVEGLELVAQQISPIELERLKQEMEEKRMLISTNPSGNVQMEINATELFDQYDDDTDTYHSMPEEALTNDGESDVENSSEKVLYVKGIDMDGLSRVYVSGFNLSQSVSCPLTQSLTTTLAGALKSENGKGAGMFYVICNYLISNRSNVEVSTSLGDNGITVSPTFFRQINRKCSCSISAVVRPVSNRGFVLGITPSITYRLDKYLVGKMQLSISDRSHLKTKLIYEYQEHKGIFAIQLGIYSSFVFAEYARKFTEEEANMRLAAKVGTTGVVVEYGYKKKVTKFTRLGATMTVGMPSGVTVTIEVARGRQVFLFPIRLSEELVPSAVIYGTFVPLICYQTVMKLVVDPYLQKQEEKKLEKKKEQSAEKAAEQKKEALAVVQLMKESVDRSIEIEEAKGGLRILKALYGKVVMDDNESDQCVEDGDCIDVSIPVQALVKNSRIENLHKTSKCEIPGFYDPCPGEKKTLYIRYKFQRKLHQVMLDDTEEIRLPLAKHRVPNDDGEMRHR